jgi:proteasome lid subunit RPN8/RPN11
MKLILPEEHQDYMEKWLEQHFPHEACGFFAGTSEGDTRIIHDLWEVPNVSTENLKRRFVVDPLDYMRAERRAEQAGLELLGIFHSHPDHPALPSEHDLISAQPYFSYIIVSVMGGRTDDIRSFRLEEGAFKTEEVIVKSLNHVR